MNLIHSTILTIVTACTPAIANQVTLSMVAKAAIATIMAKQVSELHATETSDKNIVHVWYTRKEDKKYFGYLVGIEGSRVICASAEGTSETYTVDRWRNHPLDETINFDTDGTTLKITETFSGGSSTAKEFPLNTLR